MPSSPSAARLSAPRRKSTGFVATRTRTPAGTEITSRPSPPAAPSSASPDRFQGQRAPRPRRARSRSSRSPLGRAAPREALLSPQERARSSSRPRRCFDAGSSPAHVTTPAEQLLRSQPMPPRDSRHFAPALVTLGENPRFLFGRPRPPSARSGEDLKPTTRLPLRFVQKLSVRHVSNSLSTQRRQTIDPAPHRGRCGLTTAYSQSNDRDRSVSDRGGSEGA